MGSGAGPGPGAAPLVVTAFAPPGLERETHHTVRPLHLLLHELERYLGSPFPFPQLAIAFVPPASFVARPTAERVAVGAGIILVG